MELEYIWIKKFRVIQETGFNFSTKNSFSYNVESKILTLNENQVNHNSFFGPNVSELTALIGENGVGKSSLIEFIIRNLANVGNGSFVLEKDGDFFAVFSNFIIVRNINLISNLNHFEEKGYKIINYSVGNIFLNLVGTGYENLTYIHYSNVFDYKKDYGKLPNLIDVSTNNLLLEESVDADNKAVFFYFVYSEMKRQIDCLLEIDLKVPFKLPEKIVIYILDKVYKYKSLIDLKKIEEKKLANIIELCNTPTPNQPHDKVKLLIYQNLLKYRSYNNPMLYLGIDASFLKEQINSNFSGILQLNQEQQKEFSQIKNVFEKYQSILNAEQIIVDDSDGDISLLYRIQDDNSLFYELTDSINELMGVDTFMYFSWGGISSGEKSYLSMLSRLNYARKQFQYGLELEVEHVILLIDEFDLYLHPEWQRNYLDILITQIPKIFNDLKIQLIISSHSPFLASDLPKTNIIFLRKINNRLQIIDSTKKEQTFGANIHTLYTDSFFLKNTIGEFAHKKIQDLIKYTRKENSTIDSDEAAQNIIDIIGEPIVKNKLQDLLNTKSGAIETIKWHQSQIDKLLKELL